MAKKKFLTLDDLYNYYASTSQRTRHFSSKEADGDIIVQSFGKVKFEKNAEDSDLTAVTLQACHTGDNLNHFNIEDDVMEAALPTFLNKPILAYIHEVDGQLEFYDHRMHQDEDGNIVYDEVPVGIMPESSNPHLEYDEDKEKTYVIVNGYLFNEYSHAAEILEREEECAVSVELDISDLSYNPKTKIMVINAFRFSAVTILGKRPDGTEVHPGMAGSNIKLGDFTNQNSLFSENIMTMLEELNNKIDNLSNFSNINPERKEDEVKLNKELFEQLLEQYNVTEADIQFQYSELDDDALKEAFKTAFDGDGDSSSEGEGSGDDNGGENDSSDSSGDSEDSGSEGEDDSSNDDPDDTPDDKSGDDQKETNSDDSDDEAKSANHDDGSDAEYLKKVTNEVQYSATFAGQTKTFAQSLNEVIYAITELVNATYGEADNAWYSCEVFDDKTIIMHDWWSEKHFKQKYTVKDDVYSLKGDRVELFVRYLTQEEIDALDGLKSKFEEVSDKLAKYEAEPEKIALMESADYANIANSEDFVALKEQSAHFDLSIDELKGKCDEMLLAFAKGNKIEFAVDGEAQKKPIGYKRLPFNKGSKAKTSRYGKLL